MLCFLLFWTLFNSFEYTLFGFIVGDLEDGLLVAPEDVPCLEDLAPNPPVAAAVNKLLSNRLEKAYDMYFARVQEQQRSWNATFPAGFVTAPLFCSSMRSCERGWLSTHNLQTAPAQPSLISPGNPLLVGGGRGRGRLPFEVTDRIKLNRSRPNLLSFRLLPPLHTSSLPKAGLLELPSFPRGRGRGCLPERGQETQMRLRLKSDRCSSRGINLYYVDFFSFCFDCSKKGSVSIN